MRWILALFMMVNCFGDCHRAEKVFCESSQHVEQVTQFVKKHLIKKIDRFSFLDIGPGNGYITHKLSDKFQFVNVIDPDNFYLRKWKDWGFLSSIGRFQDVRFKKFDLVICSRVLETVPWSQWEGFVKNFHRCIEGKGLIVINAPRGKWHVFCRSINSQCLDGDDLREVCGRLDLEYKVYTMQNVFRTFNRGDFREVVWEFILQECARFDVDRGWLEREVDGFVDSCRDSDGSFCLVFDMDYFVL